MSGREPSERKFRITPEDSGERLDVFLAHHCPDLSRNQIQNAVQKGQATVDGKSRSKSFRLTEGSEVCFRPSFPEAIEALPQPIPLDIVYEDEDLLIVNKPAGMVVHPAPGHPSGTLVNALLHHCHQLAGVAGGLSRPGLVHRLDQDTTGLMVVALNDQAHLELTKQLKDRKLGRRYVVLSWGCWPQNEGDLFDSIGRHPRDRLKMAVLEAGGRSAKAHYLVLEDFGFVQLCQVVLDTGRTHQIRVQFAHAGHPVVGDPLYGDDRRARNVRPVDRPLSARMVKGAQRQMLHAFELTLAHPRLGKTMNFTSDLPEDMATVLKGLRQ